MPSRRRAQTSPGIIGSQKLSPRNNSVADKPTGNGSPMLFNDITDAVSNVPKPPGMMPMVRKSVETMKLANTPPGEAVTPSARAATQIVEAARKLVRPS